MRILLLAHSFNSLTQRIFVLLQDAGHDVSVEFDINDAVTVDAVERFEPDLVIAPFLKRAIPESVWARHTCFVVHPGVPGDRGPSALDWAVLDAEKTWGVTVLQATGEMDAGPIWASAEFPMRDATKASLYRREVAAAAVEAVSTAVERFRNGDYEPPAAADHARGRLRPLCRQVDRQIDWERDSTEAVLRKIHSADGFPGLRATLAGRELYLYDAREAATLCGSPGEIVATSGAAIGVATRDGGLWIGHLRDRESGHPFKLPAVTVLGPGVSALPKIARDGQDGYREILTTRDGDVAVIDFEFYNGAMSTGQCARLLAAFTAARNGGARVIVLAGGRDFWSNGMHLNLIEASDSPADASWQNINAIDNLAEAIIRATDCLVVAALSGNAGAGGVFLARAADYVWSHEQIVLNPHYKDMGNLYGSEFWTYLLPRTCGVERSRRIMESRLPMGAREAVELGVVDEILCVDRGTFRSASIDRARRLCRRADVDELIAAKASQREADEAERPLAEYRSAELERMRLNFYGFDPSYHVARYDFVYKTPRSHTPLTIARHRRVDARTESRHVDTDRRTNPGPARQAS